MNWDEIAGEIAAKAGLFEQFHLKKPGKLLLGKQQWKAMGNRFRNTGIPARGDEGEHRPVWGNLIIYLVDDESYIEVNA